MSEEQEEKSCEELAYDEMQIELTKYYGFIRMAK